MNDHDSSFSDLHNGLVQLVSRLLRPIWFKAPIVVIEPKEKKNKPDSSGNRGNGKSGKIGAGANGQNEPPRKVDLLLTSNVLQQIREPLFNLQNMMKLYFLPAVQNEPPSNNVAKKEERSLHGIYRLVSRSVQCLDLLDLLVYAHELPCVPQVQWGLLSRITFSRLVVDHVAHQQVKKLIAMTMTTMGDDSARNADANGSSNGFSNSLVVAQEGLEGNNYQADKLAFSLSRQCFLYFSNGDRLSYEGFKLAKVASMSGDVRVREEVGREAASVLRKAALHWRSASIVCQGENCLLSGPRAH